MKSIILTKVLHLMFVLVVFLCIIFISGCESESKTEPTPEPTPEQTPEPGECLLTGTITACGLYYNGLAYSIFIDDDGDYANGYLAVDTSVWPPVGLIHEYEIDVSDITPGDYNLYMYIEGITGKMCLNEPSDCEVPLVVHVDCDEVFDFTMCD